MREITYEEAEELWQSTDYACFACEQEINPINHGDATAFYLAGYNAAVKKINELLQSQIIHRWAEAEGFKTFMEDHATVLRNFEKYVLKEAGK